MEQRHFCPETVCGIASQPNSHEFILFIKGHKKKEPSNPICFWILVQKVIFEPTILPPMTYTMLYRIYVHFGSKIFNCIAR